MTRSLVGTLGLSVVVLSAAALGHAEDREDRSCSIHSVAGAWGYSESGTLYHPVLGPIPYASVGHYTIDHDGALSGARTASAAGNIQPATVKGTATVDPDCTGTLTLSLYDASNNLLNTVVKFVVYVDNSRASRSLITDVVMPDGSTHVKAVLVTDAKKIFHDGNGEHDSEHDR